MVPAYLKIKWILEPIILGPGIFWLLLIWMIIVRRKSKPNKERHTYRIGLSGLILITALTTPPVLEIVSLPLYLLTPESSTANADAIVVLGCGVKADGSPSYTSMKRAYNGSNLLLEGRAPFLLLTTGRTNPDTDKSEAVAMRLIAKATGVPESKIILDEKSYNTYTNAVETKKTLNEHNLKSIILVTSFTHFYRAYLVFKKQGIEVIPFIEKRKSSLFSVGWWRTGALAAVLHEYGGIMLYKYRGWL